MSNKYTLAEIEVYMRKAAQATGLGWGLAEESGKAARWLAAFDLPGPAIMLAHLNNLDGVNYQAFIPDCSLEPWQSSGGVLCPIISGAAIADRSAQMLEGKQFNLGKTAFPILLAAAVGQAARCHKTVFSTGWAGVSVSCFENGLSVEGNRDDLLLTQVESVSCQRGNASIPQLEPSTMACAIDADIWAVIDQLAFKTYAPATEESRAGAGAGMIDND
jgi:hypothetical protein